MLQVMRQQNAVELPKIDRGVPFQQKRQFFSGREPKWGPYLIQLGVGDSFVVPKKNSASIYTAARRLKPMGFEFKGTLDKEKNEMRFWRTK